MGRRGLKTVGVGDRGANARSQVFNVSIPHTPKKKETDTGKQREKPKNGERPLVYCSSSY